MKKLRVVRAGELSLEMAVPGRKTERLALTSEYPSRNGTFVFQQLGLLHLIAPHLPNKVEADFEIHEETQRLINQMYQHSDKPKPFPRAPRRIDFGPEDIGVMTENMERRPQRAVVAYSAGKDSLWNMAWATKEYGPDNVMAVHINGLNRSCGSAEREWSRWQARELRFRHFRTVDLHNGSTNAGYDVMRSRDLFLTGILAPIAQEFGAARVITEGFAEAKAGEPFSGQEKTMRNFNLTLYLYGMDAQVVWRNKMEMDIIAQMYQEQPAWMPYMSNCFSMPNYKISIRRSWQKNAPSFPLYESQCGSCVKCRITNVARVLYDKRLQRTATTSDIITYLKSTERWTRERYAQLSDMLEGSYMRDLKVALHRYGLDIGALAA